MVSLNPSALVSPPTADVPTWDIDPYDLAILEQPEPFFAELRERGPLVWLSRYGIFASGRYDIVKEIFSDWNRFVSSRGIGMTDFKTEEPWRTPSLTVEADPPYHTKTRKVVARALSARAIAELKDEMLGHAEAMIGELLERDRFDAVTDLAEAFPLEVFPNAVGVGPEGREKLITYAAISFNFVGPDNSLRRDAMAMGEEVIPWVNSRCERSAVAPGSLAATIYAAADAGEVNEEEAALLVRSLLSAGLDTTISGIGNALLCLAKAPDQFALLKLAPGALARAAFDEGLRRISPVTHFYRTSGVDTEVAGIAIPEGKKIHCSLAAANLDPAKWTDPDRYDIQRSSAGQVAFGIGIHNCLGQVIARAEAEALLSVIARRVERLEIVDEPRWRLNNSVRALDSLPMRMIHR